MFGIVTNKKLIKEALSIYFAEETSKATSAENLMYRMGNANALNGLCARLGINLTEYIKRQQQEEDNGLHMG